MKILVLMSTYNGERFVKEQIDSILEQEDVEIGLLIRDDGSYDNTAKILKTYSSDKRIVDILLGNNVGSAESFKLLLLESIRYLEEYDLFSFSDQDDVWLPNKLSVAASILCNQKSTTPNLYCSNLIVTTKDLKRVSMMWPKKKKRLTKGESLVDFLGTGCTFVFNKCTLKMFNSNVPDTFHMHDLWIFHLCTFFGKVYYDERGLILYRQHGKNVVGAKSLFYDKIRSWMHSLVNLNGQFEREEEAKRFLSIYENELSSDDIQLLKLVAFGRKSFMERIKWIIAIQYPYNSVHMVSRFDNLLFKFRIIIGRY